LVRVAAASSPAPAQFDNQLEQWQGPRGGVNLSRFPRDGVVVFGSEFSTLRGPAFQRQDNSKGNFRGFEVHILRKGGGEAQYGFCTPDFKRGEGYTGNGCGDDGNSWAWDGYRHSFYTGGSSGGSSGRVSLPQLVWSQGDVLTFACDFASNSTTMLVNGVKVHEYAFSPALHTLYPGLTSNEDEIQLNFGSKPFLYLGKRQSATTAVESPITAAPAVPVTHWHWPRDQPPSHVYSDGDDGGNMVAYAKLALPLLRNRDRALLWARFLRCALYFAYATSAVLQRSKRTLLLQVMCEAWFNCV
jgi:hypothetical protein